MSLKPRNILQAAAADLARRKRNIRRHQGEDMGGYGNAIEQYAFHAPHVRRARNVGELLDLALKRQRAADNTTKKNTRLIYGDPDLLIDALMIFTTEP